MYSPTKEAFEQMKDYEELNEFEGMLSNMEEDIQTVRINFDGEVVDLDDELEGKNRDENVGGKINGSFENWNGFKSRGREDIEMEKEYDSEDGDGEYRGNMGEEM